jgi:hypothetical protein
MSSLLPDMEESDMLSALEGRIFYNPEEDGYEVADKFISGNVIEKAERIESWLLDHPEHEEAKQSLPPCVPPHRHPFPLPIWTSTSVSVGYPPRSMAGSPRSF